MLSSTYCKDGSKYNNIKNTADSLYDLQVVCCFNTVFRSGHCLIAQSMSRAFCQRRLAALFLEKGIKKLPNIPCSVNNLLQTVMNPRARQPEHFTEFAKRHINVIPPSVSEFQQIIGQQAQFTARLEFINRL